MKPEDMRALFDDALAEPTPIPRTDTDDIVKAGRRSALRHRAAKAGYGALAAVTAAALVVAVPMVFAGQEGPAVEAGDDHAELGEICVLDELPDEQAKVARNYQVALEDHLFLLGADVDHVPCGDDLRRFTYSSELEAYRYHHNIHVGDRSVILDVDVYGPFDGPVEDRMAELAGCDEVVGTCTLTSENEQNLVLEVEEVRQIDLDDDGEPDGEPVPADSALIAHEDGSIVHVRMTFQDGSDPLEITPRQLGELAAALPVGATSGLDSDTPSDGVLIDQFLAVVADHYPGSSTPPADSIEFAEPGDSHYGQDGTEVAHVEVTLEDGSTVNLFLQKTPVDAPGDGAGQTAAEHYARCAEADECEYVGPDGEAMLVHRTFGAELTSLEFRNGGTWVVGVGAGDGAIDFAGLDDIVGAIE